MNMQAQPIRKSCKTYIRLVSRNIFLNLTTKLKRQPINNQKVEQFEQLLHTKENSRMVNKHIKRCSPSLVIREVQIKTKWEITIYPLEWPIVKRSLLSRIWSKWDSQ